MSENKIRTSELSYVETPLIKQLAALGWKTVVLDDSQKHDSENSFRSSLADVIIAKELKEALQRLNPWLSDSQADDLVMEMQTYSSRDLLKANTEVFDRITVGFSADNQQTGETNCPVRVIDYSDVDRFNPLTTQNSFLAISQFKLQIPGMGTHIIPDIVLFVNGLPLVIIECKSRGVADPIYEGIEQLMRYQDRRNPKTPEGVEELFYYNQFMVSTSFNEARYSTITGNQSHYIEWKDPYPYKISDIVAERAPSSQEILVQGMLEPSHFLDILQNYTVYKEDDEGNTIKVVARYQQYRGTRKIIERLRSGGNPFDKGGTIWHTQGSGKSLTMMFVIRKMYNSVDLADYKIVLLLDRTDLQKQLFKTSRSVKYTCHVAKSSDGLRKLIQNTASDITIAMVHKFGERGEETKFPVLNRSNKILLMIDEAHRSQYNDLAANMWQSMPNAVKVAFTGTPLDKTTNTFGGYIDTYTMRQAVDDVVVVEIKYEGRATESEITDPEAMNNKFADIFGMIDSEEKQRILNKSVLKGYLENWTVIRNKANDMLDHYINTVFANGFKAQIVAYSREAAYRYLKVIEELLPIKISGLKEHNPNNIDITMLEKLKVACIISAGNNDKPYLKELADESKNEKIIDGFKMPFGETDKKGNDSSYGVIIVKSMLLTGFDAPIEQVMYLDQIIRDHNLLQAIARVNRTCGNNKKCGYVVDYIGVTKHLKEALSQYADADVDEMLDVLKQHNEDIDKLHSSYLTLMQFIKDRIGADSLGESPMIIQELVADPELREQFNTYFRQFSKLFDRVLPDPFALKYKDEYKVLAFIRQSVANSCRDPRLSMKDASNKVRAIIEEYLAVNGVNPKIPPISILSPEFGVHNKNKKSTRQKCDELTYAIREYININQPKDPEFFNRMSEKLEKLLQLFKDNWEDLHIALKNMRQDDIIAGRERENTFGFDPKTEMPFFAMIKKEIYGDKDYTTFSDDEFNELKDVVTDILSAIKTNTAAINFWGNLSLQKSLRTYIINQLLKNPLFRSIPSVFENRKAIAQKIIELAFCHYGRGEEL